MKCYVRVCVLFIWVKKGTWAFPVSGKEIWDFFDIPSQTRVPKNLSWWYGGLSIRSSVRRPGSEDPHRRQGNIYIDSLTDKLYYFTQLVQMNCTSVNTTHINRTQTHTLYIYIDICTDILTNESPSKKIFMKCFYQSQLRDVVKKNQGKPVGLIIKNY